ncbi:MAG TPA: hypothetical protein VMV56_02860 [Williamwhitmania sp.]|nr:hypothetical protein [Williamwhitmania sp.]
MSKFKVSEFKEFYEVISILNKGFVINEKAVLFKSKMSNATSRNIRKLKSDYESDMETVNKIMSGFYCPDCKKRFRVSPCPECKKELKQTYSYSDDIKKIQEKYSNKTKDGMAITKPDKMTGAIVYDIPPEKMNEFAVECEALKIKFATEIKERDDFLDSENQYDIHVVTDEHFPDLPQNIADKLFPMREPV